MIDIKENGWKKNEYFSIFMKMYFLTILLICLFSVLVRDIFFYHSEVSRIYWALITGQLCILIHLISMPIRLFKRRKQTKITIYPEKYVIEKDGIKMKTGFYDPIFIKFNEIEKVERRKLNRLFIWHGENIFKLRLSEREIQNIRKKIS